MTKFPIAQADQQGTQIHQEDYSLLVWSSQEEPISQATPQFSSSMQEQEDPKLTGGILIVKLTSL